MNIRSTQALVAVILIVLGALLLAGNLSLFSVDIGEIIGDWWPTVIIAVGVWKVAIERSAGVTAALIFIGVGAFLLLLTLDIADWDALWPVLIILIGAVILFQGFRARRIPPGNSLDTVNFTAIFGGGERRVLSQQFRGGEVTAIFGGLNLDLRGAHLADGATLNITAIFGGAELRVPQHWQVAIHGTPIFGGMEDKDAMLSDPNALILRINASVLFGGLEIKRFQALPFASP